MSPQKPDGKEPQELLVRDGDDSGNGGEPHARDLDWPFFTGDGLPDDAEGSSVVLKSRLILWGLTALWTAMVLWDFGLPGLYFDEVNHYAYVPGILSEEAARLPHFRLPDNLIDLRDGVSQFPILGGSVYNSTYRPYLSLPFFLLTDFSTESLRLFSGVVGLGALLLASGLCARLFGWTAGLLFGLVVATDPTNVFSLRSQGGAFWFIILFGALAGHLMLSAHRRDRIPIWMPAAAGVSVALIVHSYFVGVFLALPLTICGMTLFRRRRLGNLFFLGSALAAYSPAIYAIASIYLTSPGRLRNFGMPAHVAADETAILSSENLERFLGVLEGGLGTFRYAQNVVGAFSEAWSPFRMAGYLVAVLTLFVLLRRARDVSNDRHAFYQVAAATLSFFSLGMFALRGTNLHHLIPAAVLVVLLVASLFALGNLGRKVAVGVCAVLIVSNCAGMVAAHRSLNETGGLAYHNENYSLSAELFHGSLRDYRPVFASWGSHLQFLFQTRGTIPYSFIGAPSSEQIEGLLDEHGRIAIVVDHKLRADLLEFLEDFDDEMQFVQRNGRPLFDIILIGR